MTITPALAFTQRPSVAASQRAAAPAGSELDKFQQSEVSAKKNSLWNKMGLTALGLGSVGGTIGFGLRAATGWANAFPVCTMAGLGIGLALGAAAWAIEHKNQQDAKKAALQPPPQNNQTIELNS